jgi:hypothetical protein
VSFNKGTGLERLDLPNHGVFAGSDMVAAVWIPSIKSYKVFGEVSTISYSTYRNLVPVRGLGTINPKGFTRGPRTIAGSLVFTVFDRHVLFELQWDLADYYAKMLEENNGGNHIGRNMRFLTDEIPPFDIIISMMNERDPIGATIRFYGIRVASEGQVMSINDLITENTMQYMAEGIDLMTPDYTLYNAEFESDHYQQMQREIEYQKKQEKLKRLGFLWGK